MAYSDYVIAMTSVCDTEKAFDMLSDALISIDSELSKGADTERVPLKISTQAKFQRLRVVQIQQRNYSVSKFGIQNFCRVYLGIST